MQQGGKSSPFDRNMGITLGLKAINWFVQKLEECKVRNTVYTKADNTVVVLGLTESSYRFTPVVDLIKETDFELVFFK